MMIASADRSVLYDGPDYFSTRKKKTGQLVL